jgi:hypothetical protein
LACRLLESATDSFRKNQMTKGHPRQTEGDENQRRQAARDARAEGKRPSEMRATLGASKQRKESSRNASHSERVDQPAEGKRGNAAKPKARPGNRDRDPNRNDRGR